MRDHVRNLLPLDAAGLLESTEAEQVAAHLAECATCAIEAAAWRRLAGELGRMAVSAPSPALVARTRQAAAALLTEQSERRWTHSALGASIVLGWLATSVAWLVIGAATRELALWLQAPVGPVAAWFGTYLLAGTLAAAAAAVLLGRRVRDEGRTA